MLASNFEEPLTPVATQRAATDRGGFWRVCERGVLLQL
jgi:hypothetical protein